MKYTIYCTYSLNKIIIKVVLQSIYRPLSKLENSSSHDVFEDKDQSLVDARICIQFRIIQDFMPSDPLIKLLFVDSEVKYVM